VPLRKCLLARKQGRAEPHSGPVRAIAFAQQEAAPNGYEPDQVALGSPIHKSRPQHGESCASFTWERFCIRALRGIADSDGALTCA
jgi:hypothetical protein